MWTICASSPRPNCSPRCGSQVVEATQEKGQDIVSVRFSGLTREAADAGAEPFNELWHLVRPADGSGDWAIAGITPVQ